MNGLLTAGVVFEVETTDHGNGNRTYQTEVAAEGGNIKMNVPAEGKKSKEGTVIFRGDRREVVVVDHENKSYMVIDSEMIQSIAGSVNQAMSQVEEALKNVPESQRAMMEKLLKDKMPKQQTVDLPKTEIKKAGGREKHNGYSCVQYDVLRDGTKIRELWVTDWDNVSGGDEAAKAFKEMGEFFTELQQAFAKLGSMGGMAQMEDAMYNYFAEIEGFPVVSREFGKDGRLESESNLRSSKKVKLDPDDFEPPAGYKRQQMIQPR